MSVEFGRDIIDAYITREGGAKGDECQNLYYVDMILWETRS